MVLHVLWTGSLMHEIDAGHFYHLAPENTNEDKNYQFSIFIHVEANHNFS